MPTEIRRMTQEEYDYFYAWSVEHHARELMEQSHMPLEKAMKEAGAEFSEMLPEGLDTPHNHLMTILDCDTKENIGFIWTLHEVTEGRKQSFVCDFAIWEAYRRKGYAFEALRQAEKQAANANCVESVLFVSDNNIAANALYQKCSYRVLREKGCGKYMIKPLL